MYVLNRTCNNQAGTIIKVLYPTRYESAPLEVNPTEPQVEERADCYFGRSGHAACLVTGRVVRELRLEEPEEPVKPLKLATMGRDLAVVTLAACVHDSLPVLHARPQSL